jgi:phosphoadenosine phosphosulfate reductase
MAIETLESVEIGEDVEPETIVRWTLERFAGRRIVLTTSFGMEGCALVDMVARHGQPIPVVYLDTMFLFPETHALRDRMEQRYPHLRFENRGTQLTPREQEKRYGAELWRRNPDACCRIRKVEPMRQVLAEADVWMTGLMRSQSAGRAGLRAVEWDTRHRVRKVNPLAGWDRARVWEYVRRHDVPYNELHERGYPSIGCVQCTAAVTGTGPADYTRAGRWSGTSKNECGLHETGESRNSSREAAIPSAEIRDPRHATRDVRVGT